MARDLIVRYRGDVSGLKASSAAAKASISGASSAAAAAARIQQRYAAAVQVAARASKAAGTTEAAAARKVGIEQLKVQEIQAKGKASASQVAVANDRLATAQEKLGKAQDASRSASERLTSAQAAQVSALKRTGTEVDKAASVFGRFGPKVQSAFSSAAGSAKGVGGRIGQGLQSGFKAGVGGLGRVLRGGLLGLSAVAAGAGLAVGGVLVSAISRGGARLDAIDQARGKLSGLGNDAKDITKIMNDALASVKGTAFGLDEAATVSATAVAAGIKPGKELQRTLKLVADTATIGNTSLSESGAIVNKVATSNKAYTDTLNQLSDRGIPIYQLLAKQTGKNTAEVAKMASQGKIDFKTFQDALENGLGGAALKSGDTFQGALKNAKAALGRFGAGLLAGAFPQLKGVFGDVTKGLDGLTPTARRIGTSVGKVFGDLVSLAKALGPVLSSVGRIASSAFGGFADSIGGGKGAIKSLTDFVSTHQADIVGFFTSAGHAAISFAKVGAVAVSGILSAYVGLQSGIQATLEFILSRTQTVFATVGAAASILGLDDLASKALGASDTLQTLRDNNAKSDSGAGIAQSIADGINNSLLPALDAADTALTKTGNTEAFKASQRDAAARTAIAINAVGTAANGSQIHLKKWSDVSKLGSDAQAGLKSRISSAQNALLSQIGAQQAAGVGQKALNKTWQTGKDRLYDEFRQMGLSKKEAGRLADKYAGIKPKVNTRFTTPGLGSAVNQANNLANALSPSRLPRNIQIKINQSVATKGDNLLKNSDKNVSASGGVWLSGPRGGKVIKAASGRVLPGWSPGRDIHRFYSATAGELDLSGGEAIMRPEFTRAVGGPSGVARLNRQAESGELGRGLSTGGVASLAMLPAAPDASPSRARAATDAMTKADVDRIVAAMESLQFGVEVIPDRKGFIDLVDARIAEALRKRKS